MKFVKVYEAASRFILCNLTGSQKDHLSFNFIKRNFFLLVIIKNSFAVVASFLSLIVKNMLRILM